MEFEARVLVCFGRIISLGDLKARFSSSDHWRIATPDCFMRFACSGRRSVVCNECYCFVRCSAFSVDNFNFSFYAYRGGCLSSRSSLGTAVYASFLIFAKPLYNTVKRQTSSDNESIRYATGTVPMHHASSPIHKFLQLVSLRHFDSVHVKWCHVQLWVTSEIACTHRRASSS